MAGLVVGTAVSGLIVLIRRDNFGSVVNVVAGCLVGGSGGFAFIADGALSGINRSYNRGYCRRPVLFRLAE